MKICIAENYKNNRRCFTKLSEEKNKLDDYTKAFYLVNKMTPEIAKHSTYPLIVQKLLDSTIRLDKLSDREIDKVVPLTLCE